VGSRAGLDDVEKRQIFPFPGLELRPLGRPALSQSLYRLRYSGPENRVLRRMVGQKVDEVTGCLRKLHKGSYIICTSPSDVVKMIRSKSIRCGRHGRERAYKVLVGNLNKRDHMENLVVDGCITILKCIRKKLDDSVWTGLIWLRIWTSGRLL
jgi:hypothetical protein